MYNIFSYSTTKATILYFEIFIFHTLLQKATYFAPKHYSYHDCWVDTVSTSLLKNIPLNMKHFSVYCQTRIYKQLRLEFVAEDRHFERIRQHSCFWYSIALSNLLFPWIVGKSNFYFAIVCDTPGNDLSCRTPRNRSILDTTLILMFDSKTLTMHGGYSFVAFRYSSRSPLLWRWKFFRTTVTKFKTVRLYSHHELNLFKDKIFRYH